MKLLVTGGAGFIGSHVVEQALASGFEVGVLDNLSTGKRENVPRDVGFFEVDLRDGEATERALEQFRPDVVSHQAAQASVSVSTRDPAFDAQVNVVGGIHLLQACTKVGVRRLVFASTGGAIYGEVPEPELASETRPAQPFSPYAISKLTMEHLLAFYLAERGLEHTVLRYANVYGPRQDAFGEAGVVAIFAQRVSSGQSIQVNAREAKGDAGCIRDYTFVRDVARANLLALQGALDDRIMNVGTGVGCSTEDLAAAIVKRLGRRVPVLPSDRRPGDLSRSVLDATRTRRALGSLTDLEAGLAVTLQAYQPGS